MAYMRDVKTRIKQARKRAEMSQQVLADKLGLSRQMISFWENLERADAPSVEQVHKIGDATGESVVWLLLGLSASFSEGPDMRGRVPVVSWVQAGKPELPMDLSSPIQADTWVLCP